MAQLPEIDTALNTTFNFIKISQFLYTGQDILENCKDCGKSGKGHK